MMRAELASRGDRLREPCREIGIERLRARSRLDGRHAIFYPARFMRAYDLIRKKRDGGQLTAEELQYLVWGATSGGVADEQLAAFLMAVFFRGMELTTELPA